MRLTLAQRSPESARCSAGLGVTHENMLSMKLNILGRFRPKVDYGNPVQPISPSIDCAERRRNN